MDSERFDRLARSLGQTRSRRQTLCGLAGAGALVALLTATPVAADKPGKPNKPGNKPGTGQPVNSPPGSGQNGQLGNSPTGHGQLEPDDPGLDCQEQCEEQCEEQQCEQEFGSCLVGCGDEPTDLCTTDCEDAQVSCEEQCGSGCMERCEGR